MSYKLIKSITDPLIERVKVLEEKIYEIEKKKIPKEEITDTERLNFIENNMLGINTPDFDDREEIENVYGWCVYDYDFDKSGGINIFGQTLRETIDAAMRGSDGE